MMENNIPDCDDEPPSKMKKENEEAPSNIKEEVVDLEITSPSSTLNITAEIPTNDIGAPLVNHRVRMLPSWLQPPIPTNNVKIEENSVKVSSSSGTVSADCFTPPKIKVESDTAQSTSDLKISAIPLIGIVKKEPTLVTTPLTVTDTKGESSSGTVGDTANSIVKKEYGTSENVENSGPSAQSTVNDAVSQVSSSTDPPTKPPCRYGAQCYRENQQHRRDFSHPPGSDPSRSPVKPRCRYGVSCFRKNEAHRRKFMHDRSPDNGLSNRRRRTVRNAAMETLNDSSDNEEFEDFWTDGSSDDFDGSEEEEEEEEEEEDSELEDD